MAHAFSPSTHDAEAGGLLEHREPDSIGMGAFFLDKKNEARYDFQSQ